LSLQFNSADFNPPLTMKELELFNNKKSYLEILHYLLSWVDKTYSSREHKRTVKYLRRIAEVCILMNKEALVKADELSKTMSNKEDI